MHGTRWWAWLGATALAAACRPPCAAQEATLTGSTTCCISGLDVFYDVGKSPYVWDGTRCRRFWPDHCTCTKWCEGGDCDDLYETRQECLDDHRQCLQ